MVLKELVPRAGTRRGEGRECPQGEDGGAKVTMNEIVERRAGEEDMI